MSFESELVAHLKADAAVVALIADRITPQPAPEGGTKPCITYLVIHEDPQTDLDGDDGALLEERVQIDCWARSQSEVRELAEAVRVRMKTPATHFAAIPTPGSSFGDYEETTKMHRFSRDFSCMYSTS